MCRRGPSQRPDRFIFIGDSSGVAPFVDFNMFLSLSGREKVQGIRHVVVVIVDGLVLNGWLLPPGYLDAKSFEQRIPKRIRGDHFEASDVTWKILDSRLDREVLRVPERNRFERRRGCGNEAPLFGHVAGLLFPDITL